jgi:hypothetical protein
VAGQAVVEQAVVGTPGTSRRAASSYDSSQRRAMEHGPRLPDVGMTVDSTGRAVEA